MNRAERRAHEKQGHAWKVTGLGVPAICALCGISETDAVLRSALPLWMEDIARTIEDEKITDPQTDEDGAFNAGIDEAAEVVRSFAGDDLGPEPPAVHLWGG
jgi:hypothetical protein